MLSSSSGDPSATPDIGICILLDYRITRIAQMWPSALYVTCSVVSVLVTRM